MEMNPMRAEERYSLDLAPAPGWKRLAFGGAALALGAVGLVEKTFGGRTATIRDHVTGEVVAVVRERPLTDEQSDFADLIRAHRTRSAEEFAALLGN